VGGDAVALAGQAEQQVLGADPVLLQLPGLAGGQAEHERDRLGHGQVADGQLASGSGLPLDQARADGLLDPAADGLDLDPLLAEGGRGQALGVAEEGQQEMLGLDPVTPEPSGLPEGMPDRVLGALGDPHRRHLPGRSATAYPRRATGQARQAHEGDCPCKRLQ